MAICPPNTAINRILAALGLKNVRSLKISAEVNSAVAVVTEQYVTGTQVDDLATALETKEWVLVPKDAGRWIAVSERLPEAGETVLVSEYGDLLLAWLNFSTEAGTAYFSAAGRSNFEVTHWMPLPEPPEVK
jgi:hypothetical protein